jgi:hypothetical protein
MLTISFSGNSDGALIIEKYKKTKKITIPKSKRMRFLNLLSLTGG